MNHLLKKTLSLAVLATISNVAVAQNTQPAASGPVEEVLVTGIRSALVNAIIEKRSAENIKEVIRAEDIGKLPDQNLAEVLENVTGIQIDRRAGVGSSVQIRGSDANRIELNGVSTVSDGANRTGISFQDLPASIISAVEVIKVPEAKTIEGSVGGTINLRTIRPLELSEQLVSGRIQLENSDLAQETSPRLSGTYGNNWETDYGDIGFVISGNYTEQSVASFDPRLDRDREVLPDSGRASAEAFPFLRTQFLDQQLTAFNYETTNISTTIEWQPNDELKLYADLTINQQQEAQDSARALVSGTGSSAVVDNTENTSFTTIDLGSITGPNGTLALGPVQVVEQGILGPGQAIDADGNPVGIDPNLRTSSNTSSRETDSTVFALGGEWERDKLKFEAQFAYSDSDTTRPRFNTTLDFINPNSQQPAEGESVDNGTPFVFSATGRTLQFGIAEGRPDSPSRADLLNPANYALRQVGQGLNTNKNSETALRFDTTYDVSENSDFFTAVKAGIRWNDTSAERSVINSTTNFASNDFFFRPRADLFSDIVIAGPDNFDAADGRQLFIKDYLVTNGSLGFNNRAAVFSSLNNAITQSNAANNVDYPLLDTPTLNSNEFFDISEETTALYIQGDFSFSLGDIGFRGNTGVRYATIDLTASGNTIADDENGNEVVRPVTESTSYDFILPRINLVAEISDELLIRAGFAKDIRRPDFTDVSPSVSFGGNANAAVEIGNPQLEPEEVSSFDISAEYYLTDSSYVSIGYFYKNRKNVISQNTENPSETTVNGQPNRDTTAPCEGGGIFNPVADRNVFAAEQGQGICVPVDTLFNVSETGSQSGIELAFQYDLAEFEDQLGWASGFGFIGNYTYQDVDVFENVFINGNGDSNALNKLLGRTDAAPTDTNSNPAPTTSTLSDDVVRQAFQFENLSKNAYNATFFYDKHGFNFRARYSWRSAFVTDQTISFDLPRIVDNRAQLNLSASYEINDRFTVGIDGINLLREDRTQWCVNEDTLLCSQGLTDRRIVVGLSAKL